MRYVTKRHPTLVLTLASMAMGLVMWLAHAQPAIGQQVTIYRCTDAAGNVTLQNGVRCPKGQKQETKRLQAPTPAEPAYVPPAAVMPAPAAAPLYSTPAPPPIANSSTAPSILPPPPLYRCHAHTGNSYLSEDGAPKDRCVELQVTDLSGGQGRSGAQACEVQQDRCERITDEQLCEAWSQYDKQAQSLVALDNPEIAAKAGAMYGRTQKVMTATSCAQNP